MRPQDRNRRRPPASGRECRRRRGFTLVEAVVSIAIVAVMLVAGLSTLGASRRGQYIMDTRSRGQMLAQALMAEILRQHYEEPEEQVMFGPELTEAHFVRQLWDDVDDYHGWSASPPQDKNGAVMIDLMGWTRRVAVEWINPADMTPGGYVDTGVKKITVRVTRGSDVVASAVAIRTQAWPDDDDTLKLLFVVTSSGDPTAQEAARQTLMESWGFELTLIDASAPQPAMDKAAAEVDVAYVSSEIRGNDLGTKLRDASIGVVDEDLDLYDDFGFSQSSWWYNNITEMDVVDNTHYITSPFSVGKLAIYSSGHQLATPCGTEAAGLQVLAEKTHSSWAALSVLETGAQLWGGGKAAGRRVQVPWGAGSFDINILNENGETLMKRAIEWAANQEEGP